MKIDVMLIIFGAGIATYFTRSVFVLLSGKRNLPGKLVKLMNFIAPAILTALIAPAIFVHGKRLDLSAGNEYILAAAVTGLAAAVFKNMLVSVLCGVLSFGFLSFIF